MSTIVRYDPVMRHVTGSESGGPELPAILAANGVLFVQAPSIPGRMELLAIDEAGRFVVRRDLPEACRLDDFETSDPDATVPEIEGLPAGAVVEPPIGTRLASGDTYVEIRAPYHLFHRFVIHRWTADDEKGRLIAWAANRRWELETAGAPFRGHRVATDDRSKILMMGSVMASQMTPGWSTKWQFLDGGSLVLNGADVAAMSLGAQAYVNGLFDLFGTIKDAILAGTITTTDEIEARLSARLQAASDASAAA